MAACAEAREATMNAHLEQPIDEAALAIEFIMAAEEEDWSGVNDCGAIY